LIAPAGALILAAALASGASAQVSGATAGIVAAGAEGFGQGLGAAVTGAPSVFVTATGRAPIPIVIAAYAANIEGKAASAVEAARLRDQKLDAARAIAARFHVAIEVGASSISHEAVTPPPLRLRPVEAAAPPASRPAAAAPAESAAPSFIARIGASFRPSDPHQDPAFLDALDAAGVEISTPGKGSSLAAMMNAMAPGASAAGAEAANDPAFDRASQNAIAEARRQASVLAAAAGRVVGDAEQILLLTRNTQANEASVTVAVRFALTPMK